ncbi:SigE family RNA polymerase sigma factor [Kitasatospora viridis]|uniref:RNA polymerase sigma-70 factor (Sigma-E family) n=1 Tax=Kitasatospora viridis TaxID=281105 RepID=A0A561SEG5_9ACTN|nr:SigE family RNA polymerase sigma factor [Kitasatospora viridis]TWF73263.1 RNA polymerase sigma-70 factor (sigma-E family) [Kitasatospora viridis]
MDRTTTSTAPLEPLEFRAFATAMGRRLVRTAFLLTGGDAHLAEDLAQDTLGRIYGKWRRVSRMENPAGYAQTVLLRAFLSHRRRRASTEQVTDTFAETAVHDPDPDLRLTLLRALGQLPVQDRAVLVLRFWEDRSAEETAEVLRLSASGVRSRTSRALERLRAVLGDQLDELPRP